MYIVPEIYLYCARLNDYIYRHIEISHRSNLVMHSELERWYDSLLSYAERKSVPDLDMSPMVNLDLASDVVC